MTDSLLLSRDGDVAILTMNRPQAMNALDTELKESLLRALVDVRDDNSVRAILLTATGRGFCVGQDLHEHAAALESADGAPLSTVRQHYNPICTALIEMPKPVIAAVNGMAAGAGAGLAYACDFRMCAESGGFLMAFARIGLTADTGISWTLPRLIGHARATALLMLAEPVTSAQALEMGMVTAVVPDDRLEAASLELANRLAAGPTAAYAAIKQALAIGSATLAEALETEAVLQNRMGETADHRAATAAFLAKEPATFTGH